MKDFKKQIEKASIEYVKTRYKRDDIDRDAKFGFINGAKSEAAKAFHQQGMYTEEEMLLLLNKAFLVGFKAKQDKYILSDFNDVFIDKSWIDNNKI